MQTKLATQEKNLIVECCMCKRISLDRKQWVYFLSEAQLAEVEISHGYCAECFASAYAELEAFLGAKSGAMAEALAS